MQTQTLRFVCASDITPPEWDWFGEMVSESDPPFCWGTNNHSLISAEDYFRHVDDVVQEAENEFGPLDVEGHRKYDAFKAELLGSGVYIDLEN